MSSEEEYSDDGGDDIYQADSPMAESYDQGDGPSNYAGNSNDVNGNDQAGGEQRQVSSLSLSLDKTRAICLLIAAEVHFEGFFLCHVFIVIIGGK